MDSFFFSSGSREVQPQGASNEPWHGSFVWDVIVTSIIGVLSVTLIILWMEYRRLRDMKRTSPFTEVAEFIAPTREKRFRKRDRMRFHGLKMARRIRDNVNTLASNKSARSASLKKFTKNFISTDSESSETESSEFLGCPAEEYLDEEMTGEERGQMASQTGPNVSNLLDAFHFFGKLNDDVSAALWKQIEVVQVPAGQYLYRVGDPDVNIFIVQSGKMSIFISDYLGSNETRTVIKEVSPGETLSSLLSFIDCLTGNPSHFKTVSCQALSDSVVLKLPATSFAEVFDKNPDLLIRMVQLIMARLQRVIFVALHQFLGLTSELIRERDDISELSSRFDDSVDVPPNEKEADALERAVRAFKIELDLENSDILRDRIELKTLGTGDVLMREDSHSDSALVYILEGKLKMSQCNDNDDNVPETTLYKAYQDEFVGQLSMLTGEPNFYTCVADQPTKVAVLSRETFFEIVCHSPAIVLSLAHSTISRLSRLVRQVDFALDWIKIQSGKCLYKQGDIPNGTYIVLSGRLRSVINVQEESLKWQKKKLEEYMKGDMVGIVDVVTATKRFTTVMAIRDSELCRIPSTLLNLLKQHYPVVVTRLISILGHRLLGSWTGTPIKGPVMTQKDSNQTSFSTLAIFPSSKHVPASAFSLELLHALTAMGQVIRLTSDIVKSQFGENVFESDQDYKLYAWLGQQEQRHKVVIYQCDPEMTKWTSLCFRQADIIFDLVVVADNNQGANVTKNEYNLELAAKRIRKELILIHDEETECPRNSRLWLKRRPWISGHFHVKAPRRMFTRKTEARMVEYYNQIIHNQIPFIHSDFSRISRYIVGSSVGLVLGGGGARGAAHVGMLKAIREAGIPVDMIGGVSIGAFVGGLWASSRDITKVTQKARSWFDCLATGWIGPILDLTWPTTSLFTGSYFNKTLIDTFDEELTIEDMWIPYFCCSTDISSSRERVHTKGTFWRYCRASMSYGWLLPPVCDPVDGHLLLDGCYVNNVPGDVMANLFNAKYIIAIDITAVDDRDLTNYGDHLSGWWLLWKRLNPFATPVKIPDQSEIQLRLAFCSHYKNLEELKSNPNYEYIQPPVEKYQGGQFGLFDEIRSAGYHHGSTFFAGLRKVGESSDMLMFSQMQQQRISSNSSLSSSPPPPWFPASHYHQRQWSRHRASAVRRNSGSYSFPDLAQLVVANLSSDHGQIGKVVSSPSRHWETVRKTVTKGSNFPFRNVNPAHGENSEDGSDDTGIVL